MGPISGIKYLDAQCVNLVRGIDTVLLLGTVSNIVIVFSKAILHVVAFVTHVHRRSEFLLYLEGRTFKECFLLMGWRRQEVLQDRKGEKTYDREILKKGDPFNKLTVLKDLLPEKVDTEKKVEETVDTKVVDKIEEETNKEVVASLKLTIENIYDFYITILEHSKLKELEICFDENYDEKTWNLGLFFHNLKNCCPHLEKIEFNGSLGTGDSINFDFRLNYFNDFKELKSLSLNDIQCKKLDLNQEGSCLETLVVENCVFQEFPETIAKNSTLKNLRLANNLYDYVPSTENVLPEESLKILSDEELEEKYKKIKEDNPSLDFEYEDLRFKAKSLEKSDSEKNVLLIGASKTGKTTLKGLLKGNFEIKESKEHSSFYKDTVDPNFEMIKHESGENHNKKICTINCLDTPGLFEIDKDKDKNRSNKQLLELVNSFAKEKFKESDFSAVDKVIFTYSSNSGINAERIKAWDVYTKYLRRHGLSSSTKIAFVITRAEGKLPKWKEERTKELQEYYLTANIFKQYKPRVLFSGVVDYNNIDSSLTQEIESHKNSLPFMKRHLLNFICE